LLPAELLALGRFI